MINKIRSPLSLQIYHIKASTAPAAIPLAPAQCVPLPKDNVSRKSFGNPMMITSACERNRSSCFDVGRSSINSGMKDVGNDGGEDENVLSCVADDASFEEICAGSLPCCYVKHIVSVRLTAGNDVHIHHKFGARKKIITSSCLTLSSKSTSSTSCLPRIHSCTSASHSNCNCFFRSSRCASCVRSRSQVAKLPHLRKCE